MFDKLIESNSVEAEFKPRRKFFMVSSVVVGILFITAVVASLYAHDLDLGTENFELVDMIAPPDANAPEPEPPRQQQQNESRQSDLPVRNNLVAQIDQQQDIPDSISTTRNTVPTIPDGRFIYDPNRMNSNGSGVPTGPSTAVTGGSSSDIEPVAEVVKETAPPPVAEKPETRVPRVKSEGVINGKATYLPIPPYPPTAKMVGASGVVNVQVTIDEEGNVISSKAVSGHPLLRQTAESAAWKARFSPTYLSRVPVKVTGVIVFNFKRS